MDTGKFASGKTSLDLHNELIDIVDENDNVVGQEKRSIITQKKLSSYRVINAFLINSEGKLWIPRRTPHKSIFPSGLDVSVGGYVESGESYEMAMARELKEELNLEMEQVCYRLLGYLNPHVHDVSSFMKVYEIQYEQSPNYNPDDFVEAFWLTPKELMDKTTLEQYPPKTDLPKLLRLFYL
jgi:isopentenyldiphosphate isomerase